MKVQEWLGENNKIGNDIWTGKYQHANESLEEWFDRVSGSDEEIKEEIKEKRFIYGGRTLSNRGLNQGSLNNCFIAGTKVMTKEGIKPIEKIQLGDEVITEDGSFQKVNDLFERDYRGDLFSIKAGELYEDIVCTPNHQFLTQNGWIRADRLLAANFRISRADRLKIVDLEFPKKYDIVDITEHFKDDARTHLFDCGDGTIRTITSWNSHGKTFSSKQGNPLNKKIEMTEDFRYFIGRWLGDGSITKKETMNYPSILQIVFNQKTEENEALEIAKIGEELFGIKPSIRYTEQNVIAVRFDNQILGSWFIGEFGSKCDGKFLPSKYDGDLKIAMGLIDSDGSFGTHGAFKIVLKNLGLVTWLRNTLFLNGMNTSKITKIEKYEGHFAFSIGCSVVNGKMKNLTKKTYHDKRMNIDQKKLLFRDYILISSIDILENQSCKVYNISVEKNHTYTANGVIAHNCYSAGYCEDDYKKILELNTKLGLTYKAQGGQGVSLSKIRPKGIAIGDRYTSDGIIPFLELFNKTTEVTSQAGSRKGALIVTLDARHKQAEEFIKIKTEENSINKANLSMEIDDKFMENVDNFYKNGDVDVVHESRTYSGHDVEYDITPIDTFKLLAETSHDWAEPGVIFTEEFRNYNLMEYHKGYEIETCNPSLRKGTKILTTKGIVDIETLENKDFFVQTLSENIAPAKCFLSGKNKPLYEITLENGSKYYATKEHKWAIKDGENHIKITTDELRSNDLLPMTFVETLSDGNLGDYSDGLFFGLWYGDGSVTTRKDNGARQYGFTTGLDDYNNGILDILKNKLQQITEKEINFCKRNRGGEDWYETSSRDKKLDDYFKKFQIFEKHKLSPLFYTEISENFRRGFIDGLFSSDGHVDSIHKTQNKITVSSCSTEFILEISNLLWWYGIRNSICSIDRVTNFSKENKPSHLCNLVIGKYGSYRFKQLFNLSHKRKQEEIDGFSPIIKSSVLRDHIRIKSVGLTELREDVWDINVFDDSHTFRLNHCITGNCGKIVCLNKIG